MTPEQLRAAAARLGSDSSASAQIEAISALLEAADQLAGWQEPVALTPRQIELIDGMIGVQLNHAADCDVIGNCRMAEKQKKWDMERVALLQKLKACTPPAPAQKPLSDEQIDYLYNEHRGDGGPTAICEQFARAIEAAHGIKEKP
jgi:hypothetical protein